MRPLPGWPHYALLRPGAGIGATVVVPVTHVAAAEVTLAWLRDPQGNLVRIVRNDEKDQSAP